MANAKAVGPDELPAEFLKLGLGDDSTILQELHHTILVAWRTGTVPQLWKDAIITVLHKKEGQDRVQQLPRYLTRRTRGQDPPQGRRSPTQ